MFFKVSLLVVLAAWVKEIACAELQFHLYAYGTGMKPGLQLFYGDGRAYVGMTAPTFVEHAVNITLSQAEESTEFIARPDNITAPGSDLGTDSKMYIDLTKGTINPVGFVKSNETTGGEITTVGMGVYGGWAFHKPNGSDSDLEMKFIATPTNESDIYLIKWNNGGTKAAEDVPVSLRTQAPVVIED